MKTTYWSLHNKIAPRKLRELLRDFLPQPCSQVLSLPVGVLLESWERERRENVVLIVVPWLLNW